MTSIGVAGHRYLTDTDRVAAGVEQALCSIERAFPSGPYTALSSLAAGADRLVARQILARPGTRLFAPLPLPPADYLTDFASADEFLALLAQAALVMVLPPTPTRGDAYTAAGRYVVEHCDVLLAVWDGQPAQSQGGTGDVVALARRRGLPVAWVHAGNRRPGTYELTTLGEEQGRVSLERFPV